MNITQLHCFDIYMNSLFNSRVCICQMVCLDDQHRMKIEEPGFPVAAVERGQKELDQVLSWVIMTSLNLA